VSHFAPTLATMASAIWNLKLEAANTAIAAHGVGLKDAVVTEAVWKLNLVSWEGVVKLAYYDLSLPRAVSCTASWLDHKWYWVRLFDVVAVEVRKTF
jgi:hypothetical protein